MQRRMRGLHKTVLSMLAAQAVVLSATLALADAGNHVTDVRVEAAGAEAGATEIEVVGTAAPVFSVRVDGGGKKLIVDISDADVVGVRDALTSAVGVVTGVATQAFKTGAGQLTRLTINLAKNAAYRVRGEGRSLKIHLVPAATTAPQAGPAPEPTAAPAQPAASLSDVRFERAAAGCSSACDRVVIQTSDVPAYSLSTTPYGRVRLELKKTKLDAGLARTLDVTPYKGSLRSITASHDEASGSTTIEIDREGLSNGTIAVEGKSIVWSFDGPTKVASPIAKPAARKTVTVAREQNTNAGPKIETSITGEEPKIEVVTGSEAAGFSATLNAQAAGRYNGRRIDLDLKDADIHNILRLLADVGRVNIVTADDVQGNVTIRMKNVPWDQALDVVLQAKGLGMVRSGNLIRVAPLATLQKERELRLAAAKQEYELTPLETRLIPVSYAQAD